MDWKPKREFTPSNPTYDVDKDAPPWEPPIPPDTRWTRKEIDRIHEPTYDAYVERSVGEPIAKLPPAVIKKEVEQPKLLGELKLIIQGPTISKEVPLEKGFLEMFHESNRLQQGHLAYLVSKTVQDIIDEEKG